MAQPARTPTILVVDDEPMVLSFMSEALRRAGYAVLEAPDAETGWELAQDAESIEALVTDVKLPGMPGPELVRRLRGLRPGLPALYVSGYVGDELVPGSGADAAFLQKPFRTSDLVATVRALVPQEPPPASGA